MAIVFQLLDPAAPGKTVQAQFSDISGNGTYQTFVSTSETLGVPVCLRVGRISMRQFAIVFFAFALSLTVARADDWSKTYNIEHTPRLRVDTTDADIRIDTWDQNKIEAHVTTERWKIGEDGLKIIER